MLTDESIKQMPPIHATREAYKKFGKAPSRYRPAAEALLRRIVKGEELYKINTLADLVNLASIYTGYSIGGFDLDKIQFYKICSLNVGFYHLQIEVKDENAVLK